MHDNYIKGDIKEHRTIVPGRCQLYDKFPKAFVWNAYAHKESPASRDLWKHCIIHRCDDVTLLTLAVTCRTFREWVESECLNRFSVLVHPLEVGIFDEIVFDKLCHCYRAVYFFWGGIFNMRDCHEFCVSKVPQDVGRVLQEAAKAAGICEMLQPGESWVNLWDDEVVLVEDDGENSFNVFEPLYDTMPYTQTSSFTHSHVKRMFLLTQEILRWRCQHRDETVPIEGWDWYSNYIVEFLLFLHRTLELTPSCGPHEVVMEFWYG